MNSTQTRTCRRLLGSLIFGIFVYFVVLELTKYFESSQSHSDENHPKESQPKESQPKESQPKENPAKENPAKENHPKENHPKECYTSNITENRHVGEYKIQYLEDVMEAHRRPTAGKSIIFHETTCSKSGLLHLNSRQSCAIESAARLNPNRDIFVLFASSVGFRDAKLPTNIEILKTYPNIHFRNNDIWKYAADTPLEKWLTTGRLFESKFLFEHMSDVLRFLTLYKFGGIYMDLDVVVQRNFDHLGQNFAGDDSVDAIGCGVLHFDNDKLGRKMAEHCLRFMQRNFNGKGFIDNGPLVLTRTLETICKTKNRNLMSRQQCEGFQVYPKDTFYALSWKDWYWFFNPKMTNHTLRLTENSTVIHVWNDVSKNTEVKTGANTAYEVVAKKNCPLIYTSRINYEVF